MSSCDLGSNDSIVRVIMRRRGVFSERRRSSYMPVTVWYLHNYFGIFGPWERYFGTLCNMGYICPKCILNSNPMYPCFVITYFSVTQSFWNFAQSIAVILPYSLQNFKTIEQLKRMLWANKISQDMSLRCVSDRYPILYSTPGSVKVLKFFINQALRTLSIIALLTVSVTVIMEYSSIYYSCSVNP